MFDRRRGGPTGHGRKEAGTRRTEAWYKVVAARATDMDPDALVHPQAKLDIGPTEIMVRHADTITMDPEGKLVAYNGVGEIERAEYGWTQKQEALTGRVLPAGLSGCIQNMPMIERPQEGKEAASAPSAPSPAAHPPVGHKERVREDNPYKGIPLPYPVYTLGELLDLELQDEAGRRVTVAELLNGWRPKEGDDVEG